MAGVQESKACTYKGKRQNITEEAALETVLEHMFFVHGLVRPNHEHKIPCLDSSHVQLFWIGFRPNALLFLRGSGSGMFLLARFW